ncbi:MAG: CYTH domain protein [Bacteroidetes bacterium ADurb.Bin408]|nr:MAG: CYTH domain protein [Bacteroidetes bacterium ADurb.Bin408]
MPTETERKFLIKDTSFTRSLKNGIPIVQGYITLDEDRTVRVRTKGKKAYITIKAKRTQMTRTEFEFEIPYSQAVEMLDNICLKPLIHKTRYVYHCNGLNWEIDIFKKEFAGIVIAEVELPDENTPINAPDWLGKEVTYDPAYYNAEMVKRHLEK